jgi:hypothetical protein
MAAKPSVRVRHEMVKDQRRQYRVSIREYDINAREIGARLR